MLDILYTKQFKKDLKNLSKQGKDISKLVKIVELLQEQKELSISFKDHQLQGKLKDYRELHIEPDWLLVYKIEANHIKLAGSGSHSDLFE